MYKSCENGIAYVCQENGTYVERENSKNVWRCLFFLR